MFDFLLTERWQYSNVTGKIWFDLKARIQPTVYQVELMDVGTSLVTSLPASGRVLAGTQMDRIFCKDVKLVSSCDLTYTTLRP